MSIWHVASKDQSDECDAYAPHGYFGIKTQAVDRIAQFITANLSHAP